jgi:hypothetical protein
MKCEAIRLVYQSESYSTTMSAVVKLIPRPPALVVRRNINFSLSGLLYSSIAIMRSSWAVLPSIRQYSSQRERQFRDERRHHEGILTILTEETVVLENVQDTRHLAKYKDARAFCFHVFEKFVEDYHFASVFDNVFIGRIRWSWFLSKGVNTCIKRRACLVTYRSIKKIRMASNFPKLGNE